MIKKLTILSLALLILGSGGLSLLLASKRSEQQQAAFYRSEHQSDITNYLKEYNEWLKQDPDKRSQLPWGLNEYGQGKSQAQIQQEQQERLKADMEVLAAGEIDVGLFADVLYGENWQNEVNKYKAAKELREILFTCSILCAILGGGFWLFLLLRRAAKLIWKYSRVLRAIPANFLKKHGKKQKKQQEPANDEQEGQIAKLLSDEDSAMLESSQQDCRTGVHGVLQNVQAAPAVTESLVSRPLTASLVKETPLKAQSDILEKKVAQFEAMAKAVDQRTLEHVKPLNDTLEDLFDQVSAIREYASHQQCRVEKLQDGYDWNIVRTFCLRIIRTIDNIESRIAGLSKENVSIADLEEVRDELIFALESSGIEQFKPKINSDYRGQEKKVEAVKDKELADELNLIGKIAKVIRPGYYYVMDEDNSKIVRPAQVSLFG